MTVQRPNSFRTGPDEHGHFGIYGGRFVAETLMPLILDLEKAVRQSQGRSGLPERNGRASCRRMSDDPRRSISPNGYAALRRRQGLFQARGAQPHRCAQSEQCARPDPMPALRMGKTRIIAETGAGMHGVATATLCAKFGLPCIVYTGAVDVERQQPNVLRMKILGAEVRAVESGARTLKDAMNEGAARLGRPTSPIHSIASALLPLPASLSGNGAGLPVDHRSRNARANAGR